MLLILLILCFAYIYSMEHYNQDYLRDFVGYIPECQKNFNCAENEVCLNYYGLQKCRKKLKKGEACTTTNSLGFTYIPCGKGLACVEDYPGSPEVDVPSNGTCKDMSECAKDPSKCEYHSPSYPYIYPLPYTYPYPMYLDTLLKPNRWFNY